MTDILSYPERIIRDPRIMVGKPVVKGTRIPVATVLAHLAESPNLDELFLDYPELTEEDVKACLAYAQSLVVEGTYSGPLPALGTRSAGDALLDLASVGAEGPSDLSEHHDDYLYGDNS